MMHCGVFRPAPMLVWMVRCAGFALHASMDTLSWVHVGGFQHAVIEYARNVLGLTEADHAESNPTAIIPIIAPLTCSLMDAQGTIQLLPNTRISKIYDSSETVERYFCNFGLNPDFRSLLEQSERMIYMLCPPGFFGLQLASARKVAQLAQQSYPEAILHGTAMYRILGLDWSLDPHHPVWQTYLTGLHQLRILSGTCRSDSFI
jgi:hypothetical protein